MVPLPYGLAKGQVLDISGKGYRILKVVSATELLVDRPWWMWFADRWDRLRTPFWIAGWRLKDWFIRTFYQ